MFMNPEGQIKNKYIIPGSVYTASLWDWDSWLTNVALKQFVTEDISEYEKGCVLNFLEHSDFKGRIPIQMTPNSFLPEDFTAPNFEGNIHKPCLAQHIAFIVKSNGDDAEWIKPHFKTLTHFIDYYIENCRHESGLYFWIDDYAVGVDNDPCVFYRPKKSCGSIFLNCLMSKELEAVCYIGDLLNTDITPYRNEYENLKTVIRNNCYDEKDGFYYSVDLNLLPIDKNEWLHSGAPRHWNCLIQRIGVWSGFMAMWSGIATPEQAKRMVKENLLDKNSFWSDYGVRSLSKYEKMYSVKPTGNPSCWLGPIWGISNYMVFRGLVKYGYNDIAKQLAENTVKMFEKDISQCGELHEYYDPENGNPVNNPGFQSWNLLALNMQAWLNGKNVIEEF